MPSETPNGTPNGDVTVRLTSFQDGDAVLHVTHGSRTARVEIDRVATDGPAPEAARRALGPLVESLSRWLAAGGSLIDER